MRKADDFCCDWRFKVNLTNQLCATNEVPDVMLQSVALLSAKETFQENYCDKSDTQCLKMEIKLFKMFFF